MRGVQLEFKQSGDKLCFVTKTEERVEELVNELRLLAPMHSPEVEERSSGEGFSSPAHKFLEVQKAAESPAKPCHPGEEDLVSTYAVMPP